MVDAKEQQCRFFLLRYVPDAVKNEFVNVGVVLTPASGSPELRLTRTWSRVLGLDPQADVEMLQAFWNELSHEAEQGLALKKIEDSFSNCLQASEQKVCLTDSPAREADELARIYLEGPRQPRVRVRGGRQLILTNMQQEFERTGVWQAMQHDIPVSLYTGSCDPLKIDCAYGLKSAVKLFHATPLQNGINAAKALAFSYPALAQGIRKSKGLEAKLTAVVEDDLDRSDTEIGFAFEMLEQQAIQVAPVSELPRLAETAAQELGIG